MEDEHWEILLERIREQKCTPFLGAGASAGTHPSSSKIAEHWAREHHYPPVDASDLDRVAQFLVVRLDAMAPKEKMKRLLSLERVPSFQQANEPHAVPAELPLRLSPDRLRLRRKGTMKIGFIRAWDDLGIVASPTRTIEVAEGLGSELPKAESSG